MEHRRYYGIAEVADALGQPRPLVTAWRRRRSHNMPPPDEELSAGPIWRGETIQPWIEQTRARLAAGDELPAPPGPALIHRVARRLLRLAALLLEDEPRPSLITRAARELRDTRSEVEATADGDARTTLLALCDGIPEREVPTVGRILAAITELVPLLQDPALSEPAVAGSTDA